MYGEVAMNDGNVRKHDLDANMSSLRILKDGVDAHVLENGRFTLTIFRKFSNWFRYLSSTRLSQLNSSTDGFQEYSHEQQQKRRRKQLTGWLN
jgi:hypothetical protein